MRKYKAPGTYANFIPTAESFVSSFDQTRVMAIVGTGQQAFERKNVLIARNSKSLSDVLPDEKILSIESVSTKPITNREDQTNKFFTDFELQHDNLIVWNKLKGPEYDASVTVSMGQGNKGFLDNVIYEVTNQSLVTNDTYKIEISNVGVEGEGTYYLSRVSTGEIIGEFVTSTEPITVIPGIALTVMSTLLVEKVPEIRLLTKMGDYAILTTTAPKCHIDPYFKVSNDVNVSESAFNVTHGGSHYTHTNIEYDKTSVDKLPSISNILQTNFDYSGLRFQLSIYRNSILNDCSDCFDKLSIIINGTAKGQDVSKVVNLYEAPGIGMVQDMAGMQSAKIYDLTSHIGSELSKLDKLEIKYAYMVKNDITLDNSNIVLQLDVIKENGAKARRASSVFVPNSRLLTLNNGIFLRNTVIFHAVDNPNEIFKGLFKNIKITNKSSIRSGYYLIKIKDIQKNEISIFDYKTGELLGTWSTSLVNRFRDAIPGLSFELYSFRDVDGLMEMNGTKDALDLSGCGIIIKTVDGILNPGVPETNTEYYISYKYAKSELDFEPKIFTNYKDVVDAYGKYIVTESGMIINNIPLAAEIAFQNGANPLVIVQAKSETEQAYKEAIEKLGKKIEGLDSINSVVALSSSKIIQGHLIDHVNKYSTSEYGMYRMAYLSAGVNEPIDRIATIANPVQGSIQNAEEIYNERIVYVTPGMVTKNVIDPNTGFASLKVLPGYFLATAVAALSVKNDPAEPLTNKRILGFAGLVNHYSEPELNMLSSKGCLAIKQESNVLRVRHGVTTHAAVDTLADIQSNEITLVQIKDYVINGCRKTLGDTYIGGKLKPSIVSDMEFTLKSLLGKYMDDSIIINYEDLVVARDLSDPRQVNVRFLIEAVYPLNYIDITFGFSTTIS